MIDVDKSFCCILRKRFNQVYGDRLPLSRIFFTETVNDLTDLDRLAKSLPDFCSDQAQTVAATARQLHQHNFIANFGGNWALCPHHNAFHVDDWYHFASVVHPPYAF